MRYVHGTALFMPMNRSATQIGCCAKHDGPQGEAEPNQTHWREDGRAPWLWYAGNESLAVFRIDPRRNSEAALSLLGDKLDGLLVSHSHF